MKTMANFINNIYLDRIPTSPANKLVDNDTARMRVAGQTVVFVLVRLLEEKKKLTSKSSDLGPSPTKKTKTEGRCFFCI